ncbi:MAG: hypothetical protein QOG53_1057 [Frankiales bacterium]|jgi:hypothetical protein|nr:hypothetical protein [Frankiales bacterium]
MLPCVAIAAQLTQGLHRGSSRATAVVTVRALLLAAIAVAVGAIHLPGRPRTLCTLRALTGIPCPFCGGTTAVVELGHARVIDAVAASPLAVAVVGWLPFRSVVSLGRGWRHPMIRWTLLGAALLAAECWQLQRFGLLSA